MASTKPLLLRTRMAQHRYNIENTTMVQNMLRTVPNIKTSKAGIQVLGQL